MSGRSVVKSDIPWGGVLAYTRGQMIENDVVEAHGLHEFVAGENTKEGRELRADVSGQPIESFDTKSTSTTSRTAAASSTKEG